jgi:hypothetical protein
MAEEQRNPGQSPKEQQRPLDQQDRRSQQGQPRNPEGDPRRQPGSDRERNSDKGPGKGPDKGEVNKSAGQRGDDRGLAGVDTDGDGKPVKPGHKPGQSGGKGLDK